MWPSTSRGSNRGARTCSWRSAGTRAVDRETLRKLLEDVEAGRLDVRSAVERLRRLPYEDLGFAKVDHHRALRGGGAEAVFCLGKTPERSEERRVGKECRSRWSPYH